jgi:2-(1,2-epoxy-1,2-dihydrophenyl)acetyl-CoA isomerase
MSLPNKAVLLRQEAGVVTLTLNRPQVLNALDGDMVAAFGAAVDAIEADPSARVVVIEGAGDHFMAGGDLRQFARTLKQDGDARRQHFLDAIGRLHPIMIRLSNMRPPVLARVHGACAGFGLSLVAACDLAIAAEDAYFSLAYRHIGASPDGGSTYALPRQIGMKRAMAVALLGDRFGAAEAERIGLINWAVPAAELDGETRRIVRAIASGPSAALAATKRLIRRSLDTNLEAQLEAERQSFADNAARPDFAEGIGAFLEKRPPKFE